MPFCANEFGRIKSMLCFFNLSSFCFLNQCLTMMLEFVNLTRLTGYNVQEYPCFLLPSTGITIHPRLFTWLSAMQTQVHVSVCQPFFCLVLSSANNSGKSHLFTLDFFLCLLSLFHKIISQVFVLKYFTYIFLQQTNTFMALTHFEFNVLQSEKKKLFTIHFLWTNDCRCFLLSGYFFFSVGNKMSVTARSQFTIFFSIPMDHISVLM